MLRRDINYHVGNYKYSRYLLPRICVLSRGVHFLDDCHLSDGALFLQRTGCFHDLSGDMVKEFLNENGFLYHSYENNCHISNFGFRHFLLSVHVLVNVEL